MPKINIENEDTFPLVSMTYSGDRKDTESLMCIYMYMGREYRLKYTFIQSLAQLYGVPEEVRIDILFWAKMLHNPD